MKHRLQAFGDLIKRYRDAFGQAWEHREELETPERSGVESEFLPAALSLQDTPVSPAPRIVAWLIIAFMVITLLWAIFGHVDVVATAQGKIVPNDRIKTIQALETSKVKAIYVKDGQEVKAGDVLIELDSAGTQADHAQAADELMAARLQNARGQALLDAIARRMSPKLSAIEGVPADKLQEAQSLVSGQFAEYNAQLARIDSTIAQRNAEVQTTQAQVRKLEQTAPLAAQRAQDYKKLQEDGFISKHATMEQEQVQIEQTADLAAQRSHIKEISASIREAQAQKAELTAQTRRTSLDSITEAQQKIAAYEQQVLKTEARNGFMTLTSPVDGTVQQLVVFTVGGVVSEAQAVMVIVPHDNPLEVEAYIENKDVGFVKEGQEAEIKVETFQYTKYGTIHAKVISVSHDAINDEKRGLVYMTRIKMDKSSLNIDGTDVKLSPGMAVSAEIKTNQRRVIEYFLSPLMQYGHDSLKER